MSLSAPVDRRKPTVLVGILCLSVLLNAIGLFYLMSQRQAEQGLRQSIRDSLYSQSIRTHAALRFMADHPNPTTESARSEYYAATRELRGAPIRWTVAVAPEDQVLARSLGDLELFEASLNDRGLPNRLLANQLTADDKTYMNRIANELFEVGMPKDPQSWPRLSGGKGDIADSREFGDLLQRFLAKHPGLE